MNMSEKMKEKAIPATSTKVSSKVLKTISAGDIEQLNISGSLIAEQNKKEYREMTEAINKDKSIYASSEEITERKEKLQIKSNGKGIMDFIREDPTLSKKITFEEAVLMSPSILADVENGKQILEQIRLKYQQPDTDNIDMELEEAIETYLQTITCIEEKNNGLNNDTKKYMDMFYHPEFTTYDFMCLFCAINGMQKKYEFDKQKLIDFIKLYKNNPVYKKLLEEITFKYNGIANYSNDIDEAISKLKFAGILYTISPEKDDTVYIHEDLPCKDLIKTRIDYVDEMISFINEYNKANECIKTEQEFSSTPKAVELKLLDSEFLPSFADFVKELEKETYHTTTALERFINTSKSKKRILSKP